MDDNKMVEGEREVSELQLCGMLAALALKR